MAADTEAPYSHTASQAHQWALAESRGKINHKAPGLIFTPLNH